MLLLRTQCFDGIREFALYIGEASNHRNFRTQTMVDFVAIGMQVTDIVLKEALADSEARLSWNS